MSEIASHATNPDSICGVHHDSPPSAPNIPKPGPKGFLSWLPPLAVLIGMPLLALATTKYVLMPSVKQALSKSPTLAQVDTLEEPADLFMAKIPLSTPGSGAYSDFRSVTLVGSDNAMQGEVNKHRPELIAVARETLDGLNVDDLEKPGALDKVRAQLRSKMNKVLTGAAAREVYITVNPR